MTEHSYVTLLRRADVAARLGAVFASAIALGMLSLTVVLCVVQWTGSFALAGVASGLFSLGNAAGIALQGRYLDQSSARTVLRTAGVLCVTAVLVFVVAGATGGPTTLVLGSAAVAGVTVPALTAAVRAWLPAVFRRDSERAASYALLSVAFQTAIAVGPLVVSACVLLAGPELAAAVAGLLVGGATALYLACTRRGTGASHEERAGLRPRRRGRILSPGLVLVLALTAATGAGFGSLVVSVPAIMTDRGTPALAGVAFAAVAIGEVGGALVYGARRWRASRGARLRGGLVLLGAAYAAAALTAEAVPALLAALLVSGVAGGPVAIMLSALMDEVVPPGVVGRGYATLVSVNLVAIAGGSAATGLVADSVSPAVLLGIPAVLAVLAAGGALGGRRSLDPRPA